MTDDLAELLRWTGVYLRADGQEQKSMAYHKAGATVQQRNFIPPNPSEIDGVGSTIRSDIIEYQQTGEISTLNELREQYPYLEELCRVEGIGPKKGRRLYETLGIETIDELIERRDELPEVHHIGEKTADGIVESAKRLSD